MHYEIDMITGKKTRPVIEVADVFKHRSTNQLVIVVNIKTKKSQYVLSDMASNIFRLDRATLLRDFEYVKGSTTC